MNLKLVLKGMRLKTLPAAIAPVSCAYFYYSSQEGTKELTYFVLCLFLALFIQIATNFYNDALDYLKGADEHRIGPERITTQDNTDHKVVFRIGHIFIFLAFILGVPLVLKGGIVILGLGLISLFLAYGYTGGPFPLAYLGLGELFVFLFFGLVATCGSYYIYAGTIDLNITLIGSQIGLLSAVLIAINNFRDKDTDLLANKRTLATRLTRNQYLRLVDTFLFFPYLIIFYLTIFVNLKYFFPIFSISLVYKIRTNLIGNTNPKELNQLLALAGKHLVLFSILLCVALVCK